jgi:tetratricopeptide (TPR) repeat protein
MTSTPPAIYLSYNHADTEAVEELASTLTEAGMRVWLDRWDLVPGAVWTDELNRAVDQATLIGACIGRHGLGRYQANELARLAMGNDDAPPRVVPILLPGADRSSLPSALQTLTSVEFADSRDVEALSRLVMAATLGPVADEQSSEESVGDLLMETGDFRGASEHYRTALAALEPQRGNAVAASLLVKHASALAAVADYAGAEEALHRAIEIDRRELGDDHPRTLTAMGNLAETWRAIARHDEARGLQEQVLEGRRRTLGAEHPDTLTAMNNLAGTLRDLGATQQARSLFEQVLSYRKRVLGDEHPDTLTAMNNLAGSLWDLGDLAHARTLLEQVVDGRVRVFGDEHVETAMAMSNLAATLRSQGEAARALELQEKVLSLLGRLLGEQHPTSLAARANLAISYDLMGRVQEAVTLMSETVRQSEAALGAEHPYTLHMRENLSAMIGRRDNPNDAGALV